MALQVLLVDDEAPARLRLRSLLQEGVDPHCEVVGEAGDAGQALALLKQRACDVVLLDIGLPGQDGLRLAQALAALPRPPAVVFITAHAEHALRAFELDAVDYLTKPVQRERLQAALRRVAQRLQVPPAAPAQADGTPMLVVSDRGRMLRVPRSEIVYLKAELKYVTLRTAAHAYVLDDALADLEQRLGDGFVRIHRNAVVARHALRALERRTLPGDEPGGDGWAVSVAPLGEWLAVSRRQLAAVREAMTSAR